MRTVRPLIVTLTLTVVLLALGHGLAIGATATFTQLPVDTLAVQFFNSSSTCGYRLSP